MNSNLPSQPEQARLALVINNMNPYGGLQLNMLGLCHALLARGYRLDVITHKWELDPIAGITPIIPGSQSKQTHRKNLALSRTLAEHHRQKNYACRIGYTRVENLDFYYTGDACLLHKLKQQGRYYLRWLPRYRTLLRLERDVFGLHSNTHILTLTPKARAEIQQHYHTPDNRFSLLPPQLNRKRLQVPPLDETEQRTLEATLGLAPDKTTFLHVSSAFQVKGVDRILESLAALPPELSQRWQLVIAGDDHKQSRYEQQAALLGLSDRVRFIGPQREIARFYQIADLLLHPARKEQAGATLLEAVYFGLGVITTANVGFAHRIEDAAAGVVLDQPFKCEEMTQAIADYLRDDAKRRQWRQNALDYAASNDLFGMADTAATLIDKFVRSKTGV